MQIAKMADRRRRRRVLSSEDSEELSEGSDKEQLAKNASDAPRGKPSESEVEKPAGGESEYESAEEEEEEEEASEEDAERPVEVEDPQTVETMPAELVDEEGGQEDVADVTVEDGELIGLEGEESEEEDEVEEERQEGDGEESVSSVHPKEKVLDDDEDRRNPQYIPKKGSFYEHDDRVNVDPEEEKKDIKDKKKKKLWLDEGKWNHDMFREEEQAPKSSEELIAIYGYDIRNEDGPPRARRRRRYGRGPSKYTRNWQDEDAYAGRLRGDGTDPALVRGSARGRGRGARSRGRFARHPDAMEKPCKQENSTIPEEGPAVLVECNGQPKADHKDAPIINNEEFPALVSSVTDKNVDAKQQVTNVHRGPTKPPFPTNNKNGGSSVAAVESSPTVSSSSVVNVVAPPSEVVRTQTFENSKLNSNNHGKPKRGDVVSSSNVSTDSFRSSNSSRGGGSQGQRGRPNMANGRGRGRGRGYPMERRSVDQGNWSGGGGRKGVAGEDKLSAGMQRLNLKDANNGRHDNSHGLVKKESSRNDNKDACIVSHSHQRDSPPSSRGGEHVSASSASSSSRPKRYSSLRQRSLPESSSYQSSQAAAAASLHTTPYYEASEYLPNGIDVVDNHCQDDYQPAAMYGGTDAMPAQSQQQVSSPSMVPATHFQGYNTAPYQETYAIRPPTMPSPPRYYPPVTLAAAQTVMPTPYISPNGNIMNYAPTPTGYAQYPPFQQFTASPAAAPPPPPVNPTPQEIYRGGVTYYNTQNQQHCGRSLPQKRPKAAIPILPPPESNNNGNNNNNNNSNNSNGNNNMNRKLERSSKSPETFVEKVSEKCSSAQNGTDQGSNLVSISSENLGKVES